MADYDAVVVGASIGGCTAATLLARQGARVALVERHADPDFYKALCTHFIQASATPTIERLGLAERIEAAGGVRNGLEFWSRAGWVRPDPGDDYRIRATATTSAARSSTRCCASWPPAPTGVELLLGRDRDGGAARQRPSRPACASRDRDRGPSATSRARVVVAADGRDSHTARLAGCPRASMPPRPLRLLRLLPRTSRWSPATARCSGSSTRTSPTRSPRTTA